MLQSGFTSSLEHKSRTNQTCNDKAVSYMNRLEGLADMLGDIRVTGDVRRNIVSSSMRTRKNESMYKRLVMDVDGMITRLTTPAGLVGLDERSSATPLVSSPTSKRGESPGLRRYHGVTRDNSKLGPGAYFKEPMPLPSGPTYSFGGTRRMTGLDASFERDV